MRTGDKLFFGAVVCLMLAFIALIVVAVVSPVHSAEYTRVEPWQIDCILGRVSLELEMNPAYVWGASKLEPGAVGDCSGKIYAIFRS